MESRGEGGREQECGKVCFIVFRVNAPTTTFDMLLYFLVVGRVPGDYPGPAGYYVKMWPDPSNLSNSIS